MKKERKEVVTRVVSNGCSNIITLEIKRKKVKKRVM